VQKGKHIFNNYWHGTKKIKSKTGFTNFSTKTFGKTAESVYVEAYDALVKRDRKKLHRYITENAFTKLWPDVEKRSVEWELLEFKDQSKVVSVRCSDHPYGSGNLIAQLIVRMHSVQKLAIYDRFGHLLLGSSTEPKECLEYVVFENHIADSDGVWRLHDKVYPSNFAPKQSILRPQLLQEMSEEERPEKSQKLTMRIDDRLKEDQKRAEKKAVLDGKNMPNS
jgi:hypothetical protein